MQQPPPREITENERTSAQEAILKHILKFEGQFGNAMDVEKMRSQVKEWERKTFEGCKGSRQAYVELFKKKKADIEERMNSKRAQAPPAASSSQPTSVQKTAAPVVTVPIPQQQQQSSHRTLSSPPPTAPSSKIPSSAGNPPAAVVPPAHLPSSQATSSSLMNQTTREFLEVIREPLDHCRTAIRVLTTVNSDREIMALKDDFVRVYNLTSEILKKKSSSVSDLAQQMQQITEDVARLRARLDPRIKKLMEYLQMSFAELMDTETQPFGLLFREVELHGTGRFTEKTKRISSHIGGKICLKLAKVDEEGTL